MSRYPMTDPITIPPFPHKFNERLRCSLNRFIFLCGGLSLLKALAQENETIDTPVSFIEFVAPPPGRRGKRAANPSLISCRFAAHLS